MNVKDHLGSLELSDDFHLVGLCRFFQNLMSAIFRDRFRPSILELGGWLVRSSEPNQ